MVLSNASPISNGDRNKKYLSRTRFKPEKGVLDVSPINPAKLQKQLEKKALEEKKSREDAIANIQKIHKLIGESEKSGIDVSEFNNGLKQVQSHMREREFSEAALKSKEVIEHIENSLSSLLDERIEDAKKIVKKAKSVEIDVSHLESSLKKAEDMKKNRDFFVALQELKKAIDGTNSKLRDTASSVVEGTETLINALSETVDVSEARSLIEDAKKKIDAGDTDAALGLCEKARAMLQGAAESAAESLISDADINITILERMGVADEVLKNRLEKARKMEGPKQISEVMDIGRAARDRVKEVLRSNTESMTSEIDEIRSLGGDPSEIESLLKKASENIDSNNLALSAETLERAKKKAEEAKFNVVVKAMNPAFSKMKAASKIGANISEPEKLLLDARNALKMGEYKKAMELSKECEEKLDNILDAYQKTSQLLLKLDKLFKEAEKIKADTRESKRLLVAVKQALSERDFVKAYEFAIQTQQSLEQGKTAGIKQSIAEGRRLLKFAEEIGIDMAGEEVAFHEAEKAMEKKDDVNARKFADTGLDEVRKKIRKHIDIRLDELESDLQELKGTEDIKDNMKLIAKGRKYLEFGDFASAAETLKEIESSMSTLQKRMAESSVEKVRSVAEEILAEEGVQDQPLEDALADMLAAMKEERYSDAIRMSKDVEEKANKLAKNLSQKAYNDAKASLAKIKSLQSKIDLKSFHNSLLEARADFKNGKYVASMRRSKKIMDELNKVISGYQTAAASFELAQNAVKEAKKKGIDVKAQGKKIFTIRKLISEGKYEEAAKLSEEIREELSGSSAKQDIESRIKMIEARVFSAKTMGIELSDAEERLKRIKQMLSEGKTERVVQSMDSLENDVEKSFREAIEKKISLAETLINDARDIGINVKKAEESTAVARDALKKGDYIDAYRYAEEAQKVIDDIKAASKKVAEKIRSAHAKISEAENLRADVRNAKLILDQAIDALKANKTKESMELAEQCIKMLDEEERKKVERVINDFVKIIDKSKKTGMDASLAENLIHQARNALEEGKYQKALSLAMQSEVEMEKAELQKDIAEKAIKTLSEKIEDVRKKGISVEEVLAMLNRAEGAYDAGAYIKSFEYTMAAGEKLQELKEAYETINSDLVELESRLQDARDNRIDVVKPSELYVSAKSALEQGRVEDARTMISEALKALNEVFIGHVDEIIDYADAKIKYAKKMGANVSEAETAIKEAKKIKEKDASKALRLANGARAMVERTGIDTSFVDRAYSINFEIARAKRFGVDVREAEKLLKSAIETTDSDSSAADEKLSKADEEVKRALGRITPEMEIKVDAGELEKDVWKEGVIKVTNKGNAPAKDIKIRMSGDMEIEGLDTIDELDKGSTAELSVKIMAQKEGEMPITVKTSAKRLFDGKEFEFNQEEMLKTREKPKESAPAKETTAENPEKCKFCNGTIKPGMKMIVCGECGATYHVPCAKRIGTCKVCGASLEPKSKHKTARKKLAIKLG